MLVHTGTELEFTNVTGDTVHATDGDTITLMFKPDTSKCSNPPNRILIKVKGKSQEYCKVTIDKGICKASDQTSTVCRCVDGSENIQFSMKVDRSSDVVYNWVWSSSDTGTERHRMIRFNVSSKYGSELAVSSFIWSFSSIFFSSFVCPSIHSLSLMHSFFSHDLIHCL